MSTTDRLARLQQVMGQFPADRAEPVSYRVVSERRTDGYQQLEITYDSDDGPPVPGFLLIPDDAEAVPAPAVLSLHGTDLVNGHRSTVGLGGLPGREYGRRLAERGFVVLAPAYPTMGGHDPDFLGLGYRSGTMKAIWDNVRGIDLLLSLPQVAGPHVAAVGHSLGGHNALFTACFDARLTALAVSCGFDSFADYNGGDISAWHQDRYMPHLTDGGAPPFDFDDVLELLADRALFVNAPIGDTNFQWWSVDRLVEGVSPRRTAALELVHPDCGHDFPYEIQDRAFAFLTDQLA